MKNFFIAKDLTLNKNERCLSKNLFVKKQIAVLQ